MLANLKCAHIKQATNADLIVYVCSGEFKTNEKKIMSKIDQLAKEASAGKGKKAAGGGSMKDAVDSTESIRKWVSICFRFI